MVGKIMTNSDSNGPCCQSALPLSANLGKVEGILPRSCCKGLKRQTVSGCTRISPCVQTES